MFWLGFNPSVRPCTIASSCVILPASAAAVFGEYLRRGRQELGESEAQAAGADASGAGGGIGMRVVARPVARADGKGEIHQI